MHLSGYLEVGVFSTDIQILGFFECGSNFWCIFNNRTFSVINLHLVLRFFRDLKIMSVHLNFLCNLLSSISKLDLESQISSVPYCLEG